MSSPWKIDAAPVVVESMDNIMNEQYAHRLHHQELKKYEKLLQQQQQQQQDHQKQHQQQRQEQPTNAKENNECDDEQPSCSKKQPHDVLPAEVLKFLQEEELAAAEAERQTKEAGCDSDVVIAQMLQLQYDHEYNEELRRIEQKQNKNAKVTVTLNNFLRDDAAMREYLDEFVDEEEVDEEERLKHDWDRFETNEKRLDAIPKCGYMVDSAGGMITKHDAQLCGVRNACRVMSFPPEFSTGDAASFEMKLSNKIYNELKAFSQKDPNTSGIDKKNRMFDRRATASTAESAVDEPTRLLLYKLINNHILEQINGIVSTGKEAVILHANSDASYVADNTTKTGFTPLMPRKQLPKECAVKIFRTTLNEFKQRDRYIKDDYRFKDRFSNQNKRVVITMWAEKEMFNLMRLQSVGINCPDVIMLKKHVLVMSFIGNDHNAAPKLKDARLSKAELSVAYEEIVTAMHKMYNEAKLVHADLSEYNILWYDDKCWFIDVAQSVSPEHPSALEFLMRDCGNIINFFTKRGLSNIYSKEELFEHITSLNAEVHNAAMLESIHTKGASVTQATAPDQMDCPDALRPVEYPFELAWEKSQADRKNKLPVIIDEAANVLDVLSIKCDSNTDTDAANLQQPNQTKSKTNTAQQH